MDLFRDDCSLAELLQMSFLKVWTTLNRDGTGTALIIYMGI